MPHAKNSQERERKMDFIPEKSEIQISDIKFNDPVVKDLIRELGIKSFVNQYRPDKKAKA